MRKSTFYIVSLFLGLILFVFSIKQAGIGSILKSLSFFPTSSIVIVFLANFVAAILISTMRWKIVIEAQENRKIEFSKVMIAKLAGFTMSYVTPSVMVGGEPIRVYMLKESAGLSWEKALATAIIDQTIYFFSLLLLMIIGFLFLADHFSLPRGITYGFWAIIVLGVIILYVFYKRVITKTAGQEGFFMFMINTFRLNKIRYIRNKEKSINNTERIISDFFRNKREALFKVFLLAVAEVAAYLVVVGLLAMYLGAKVTVFSSISIFAIITLASFVPIPGSLGSMEASITFIFDLLTLGGGNGFTFSLIFRLVNVLTVIAGFFAIVYFEVRNIKDKFKHAPQELSDFHRFILSIFHRKD